MSNRTLVYLTGIVLLGMGILFAINLHSLFNPLKTTTYLNYYEIRGMAVEQAHTFYTLNFKQQNDMTDFLNRSIQVMEIPKGKRQHVNFDKIVVYQFNGKPDIIVTPLTYVDDNLIFSVPEWNANGYLMDVSDGLLKQLLSKTYDPQT